MRVSSVCVLFFFFLLCTLRPPGVPLLFCSLAFSDTFFLTQAHVILYTCNLIDTMIRSHSATAGWKPLDFDYLYRSDTQRMRLATAFNLLLFALKYSTMLLRKPNTFMIISSTVRCEVTAAQDDVLAPSNRVPLHQPEVAVAKDLPAQHTAKPTTGPAHGGQDHRRQRSLAVLDAVPAHGRIQG